MKGFEDKVMEALEKEGSAGATLKEMEDRQRTTMVTADAIEDAQVVAAVEVEETLPESQIPMQAELSKSIQDTEVAAASLVEAADPMTSMSTLQKLKARLQDMFSEQQITVRRVDLTTAMMEGAAAGVTFVGVLVFLLRPRQ